MIESVESQAYLQSLECKPASNVDFVFVRKGINSAWVDDLFSQKRVAERFSELSPRKVGVVLGSRRPSAKEIEAGTPESKISEELYPGDCLIFLPEDFPTYYEDKGGIIIIHEIGHLRKEPDEIDDQLMCARQELGKVLEFVSLADTSLPVCLMAIRLFEGLIDYRLVRWQIGQDELQDAVELADYFKEQLEEQVSRIKELKRKSTEGTISYDEALEVSSLNWLLPFNIIHLYFISIAPFESAGVRIGQKREELIKLFESTAESDHYHTIAVMVQKAREVVKLIDSGVADKTKIIETIFGKEALEELGISVSG